MAQEKPYVRRVTEVIDEEFCQSGVLYQELPESVRQALGRITERLAADLEHLGKVVQRQQEMHMQESLHPNPLVYMGGLR